jgi:hypothetical protein
VYGFGTAGGGASAAPGVNASHVFVGDRLELGGLLGLREAIGIQCPRRRPRLLEVRLIHLMRHNGRAFVHVGAQAA